MIEKTYIVIKDLPDAKIGTKVYWNRDMEYYCYEKDIKVEPNHTLSFLNREEVEKNREYFCKAEEYPEYYAWRHPVYSRGEVYNLIKECFPNRKFSGSFSLSAAEELQRFDKRLREKGKQNAEEILENKRSVPSVDEADV